MQAAGAGGAAHRQARRSWLSAQPAGDGMDRLLLPHLEAKQPTTGTVFDADHVLQLLGAGCITEPCPLYSTHVMLLLVCLQLYCIDGPLVRWVPQVAGTKSLDQIVYHVECFEGPGVECGGPHHRCHQGECGRAASLTGRLLCHLLQRGTSGLQYGERPSASTFVLQKCIRMCPCLLIPGLCFMELCFQGVCVCRTLVLGLYIIRKSWACRTWMCRDPGL